jgi:DNA-binding MarR family transcriptional regulator
MSDSIGMLLFKEKQLRLLLALSKPDREWHITDLAKEAQVTYVHTSRFISKCEDAGLVIAERHGKIKKLILTEKGREIADTLLGIIAKMNQAAQPQAASLQQKPASLSPETPV